MIHSILILHIHAAVYEINNALYIHNYTYLSLGELQDHKDTSVLVSEIYVSVN